MISNKSNAAAYSPPGSNASRLRARHACATFAEVAPPIPPSIKTFLLGTGLLLLLFATGCLRLARLPQVNLQAPDWTVREGQAVWKMNHEAPEIAGELLVATKPDGSAFVQFTKTPFPFVIAQTTPKAWQIEIPTQGKRYSAPGKPPKRFIWLHLPGALAGTPLPKGWVWQQLPEAHWRLERTKTGEFIEGYLNP